MRTTCNPLSPGASPPRPEPERPARPRQPAWHDLPLYELQPRFQVRTDATFLSPWSDGLFAFIRPVITCCRGCRAAHFRGITTNSMFASRSTLASHIRIAVRYDPINPSIEEVSAATRPWAVSLDELRSVHADLGEFFESRFVEIERLAAALELEREAICAQREQLAKTETLLDDRTRDHQRDLASLLADQEKLAQQQKEFEQSSSEFAKQLDSWQQQRAEIDEFQTSRASQLDEWEARLARKAEQLQADHASLNSESEALANRKSDVVRRLEELEAERESLLGEIRHRDGELEARQQQLNAALAANEAQAIELANQQDARNVDAAGLLKQSQELAQTAAALDEARGRLAEAETGLRRALSEQAELRIEHAGTLASLAETRGQLDAARRETAQAQVETAQAELKLNEAHALLRDTRELMARTKQEWEADSKQTVASLEFRVDELESARGALVAQLEESQRQLQAALECGNAAAVSSQRLIQAEEQVADLQRQIAALNEQVAGSRDAAERLLLAQAEQAALRDELEAARAQTARFAGTAIELADARAELLRRGERINALEREHSIGSSAAEQELLEQLRESQRERTELELELETVRARVAELSERSDAEKHRISEERSQWAGELRQLRRALELQSELLGEREAALQKIGRRAATPAASTTETVVMPVPTTNDPVLEAVREQFQRLQSNRIQRRMNVKNPGRQGVA